MKIHPSDLMLEEVLRSLDQNQILLRHLNECWRCRSKLDGTPVGSSVESYIHPLTTAADRGSRYNPRIARATEVDYGPAIERSERRYLETASFILRERAEAPGLLTELLTVQPEKRKLFLANSSRFQTWGVLELLIERSWETRGVSRAQSEELANLAIQLSVRLDSSCYRQDLVEDLKARAWSYIGNLRRIAADFPGAEGAFRMSYAHLRQGTREPLERAIFLDLKASLHGAQRQFDDAVRLLRRAVTIFLRHGDEHRAGRSLVNLAAIHSYAAQPESAIAVIREALPLIDSGLDERLLLCAWHNLIENLTITGRYIEAQGLYRKARPLYRKYPDSGFPNRRLWVKGRIARGLGQDDSAESLFIAAREGFLAEGTPYEAALVSLELAILYAEQDRTAELKRLSAEMLSIFTSRQIHREALAALIFLKQSIDAERLTIQTAIGVADFLRRAEGDPSMTFEAPPC